MSYINSPCVGYNYNGAPLSFECWRNVWVEGLNNPNCSIPYQDCGNIYNNAVFADFPNSNQQASNDFIEIYDNYIQGTVTGVTHNITIPGLPGYDILQEGILSACNKLPGICIPASRKYQNIGQNGVSLSRDVIANNTGLLNFFGCVSPDLKNPPEAANVLTNAKECDALCNREDTIKLYNADGKVKECNKSVCIIDQITIDAVNSEAQGINFNQVCNNCAGGCICIISGVDINALWSEIPDANFSQDCGSNSLCYQTNALNQLVPVDCNNVITNNNTPVNTIPFYYYIVAIIGLIILILFIYFLFIKK